MTLHNAVVHRNRKAVMSRKPPPRYQGWNDPEPHDPNLSVDAIIIERSMSQDSLHGPWRVTGVLVRESGQSPRWADGWVDPTYPDPNPARLWSYLEHKSGGNGFSESTGFVRVATTADIDALVEYWDGVLRDGHPWNSGL